MSSSPDLSRYESVPYVDGGRVVSDDPSINGLDCFGLARHALHHVFKGPLLDSFLGIFRTDKSGMNGGFENTASSFELCRPEAGAFACCFHKTAQGDVFHHVGICIDATNVMHTSAKRGYSVIPIRTFKRLANKVEFYKYIGNK